MKKKLNKKIVLGIVAMLLVIVVIAVSSFIPFIIDPTQWQTTRFLTNELIVCAIVIFSMLAMFVIGQSSNAQDERSNIAKARVRFIESVAKITDYNAFTQWVVHKLQKEDYIACKKREMLKVGLQNWDLLELEITEIKSLLDTPQKINGKYFKSLTNEQVDKLVAIKKGKYNINFVDASYYLTTKNVESTKTISEKSGNENKKKGLFFSFNILFKLVTTVIVAMVFASLVRDLTSEIDAGTAWLDFSSRMFSMISSSFMGFILGCQMNDIDAEYIENRIIAHKRYLEDKEFVAKSEEEQAKQEFIERVREESVDIRLIDTKS